MQNTEVSLAVNVLFNLDADNHLVSHERSSNTCSSLLLHLIFVIDSVEYFQGNPLSISILSVRPSAPSLLAVSPPNESHVFLHTDSFFRAPVAVGHALTIPPRNTQEIPESMSGIPRRAFDPIRNGLGAGRDGSRSPISDLQETQHVDP